MGRGANITADLPAGIESMIAHGQDIPRIGSAERAAAEVRTSDPEPKGGRELPGDARDGASTTNSAEPPAADSGGEQATSELVAATIPDHIPDAGKMVPADVWNATCAYADELHFRIDYMHRESRKVIARAIMAERERCAGYHDKEAALLRATHAQISESGGWWSNVAQAVLEVHALSAAAIRRGRP